MEEGFSADTKESQEKTLAEVLVSSVRDGLVAVNEEGTILFFNSAAGRIFGVPPEDMIQKKMDVFFPPGLFDKHQDYISKYFSGQGLGIVDQKTVEVEALQATGKKVPIEISLSSASLDGRPIVIATIRDITQRREMDQQNRALLEQLTQSQKMEALGTLAAGISHDFNNMLGAILGFATAIKMELDPKDRHYKDLKQITQIVQKAKDLTEKLLTFSRSSESHSEVLSLNKVVREVVNLLGRTLPKNIILKTRLARSICTRGDPAQLEQSLLNICLNAKDALSLGGTIDLQTSRVDLTQGEASLLGLSPGSYALLIVADNGLGMNNPTLKRAFDPFFSTKPTGEGSGLGLSLALRTVKRHQGQIEIMSQPNEGTKVKIYLPFCEEIPRPQEGPTFLPADKLKGLGETILLVDDEKHLRGMAKRLLEGLGYQILLAESGEEAIEIFRQMKDSINLVILDVMMTGMSGRETLVQLKELNQEVKVLVSSGYHKSGAPKELLDKGVCGFLQKPYSLDEIHHAIRCALDAPQANNTSA
jgi:two-component system, cell cycle sensor histidine kinase and response regulator CckA